MRSAIFLVFLMAIPASAGDFGTTITGHKYRMLNVPAVDYQFSAWVRLPNGTLVDVPVVNNYLPMVHVFENGFGKVARLELDYGYKFDYNQWGGQEDYIQYYMMNERSGSKIMGKAPAPRHPDFQRGEVPSQVPQTPSRRISDEGIDQLLESFSGRLEQIEERLDKIGAPKRASDAEIDRLIRPSEITEPESERTQNFPRY